MESDNSLILNLGLHDVVHSMLSPILSDNYRIKLNTKQQTTTHHLVLQHQGGSLKQIDIFSMKTSCVNGQVIYLLILRLLLQKLGTTGIEFLR